MMWYSDREFELQSIYYLFSPEKLYTNRTFFMVKLTTLGKLHLEWENYKYLVGSHSFEFSWFQWPL